MIKAIKETFQVVEDPSGALVIALLGSHLNHNEKLVAPKLGQPGLTLAEAQKIVPSKQTGTTITRNVAELHATFAA